MTTHVRTYRAAVRLYPRDFRREFGDDLVRHFAKLVSDLGPRRAWSRTLLDLIITLPIYRLETIMSPARSNITLNLTIVVLLTAGLIGIFVMGTSAMGAILGVVLLGAAVVVAITQRSNLARSLRPANGSRRRRWLTFAAISGVVFAAAIVGYSMAVGDGDGPVSGAVLVGYNLVGIIALVATGVFLAKGLRTPRTIEVAPASK
jgi:hypothetical protein